MALWTDDANRAFIAAHYPAHLPMYDGYDVHIKRVDAIRARPAVVAPLGRER